MISLNDGLLIASWLILVIFLHFSLLPLFIRHFPRVAIPLSVSISLLLFTLISYWLGFLHLPVQVALIPFLGILGYEGYCRFRSGLLLTRTVLIAFFSAHWRYYALFNTVFLLMLALRLYSPDISSAEKFMDHGFIASIMRIPVAPPLDPWFMGGDLSVYYYLGHWMIASLGLTAGIPSHILFNLALPTVAALAAVNLYGVGHLLLPKLKLLPVMLFFAINPAFVILSVAGTAWNTLLWNSTRVIDGTINEYPLFSFIFGDVHAHVVGIFPQTTLLLLLILAISYWSSMPPVSRFLTILCTGLALGTVPPTNTWDVLVQAPLIICTGLILIASADSTKVPLSWKISSLSRMLARDVRALRNTITSALLSPFSGICGGLLYLVLVPVIGILCYLPFYLTMQAQGVEGIGIVHTPSSVFQFLLVNGWFILIIAISLFSVLRRNLWVFLVVIPFLVTGYNAAAIPAFLLIALSLRRDGPADLLAGAALGILLFCELFFLRDNMGDQYFRMNTVFKFYISAWLLFCGSAALMLGRILLPALKKPWWIGKMIEASVPLIILLLLLLPVLITASLAGPHTPSLDGLAWLDQNHPDDHTAVLWLRGQDGNFTLVEAEGGDYGYYGRISSFTGIPTLIGWPFHEQMWRGNNPSGWYAQRSMALRSIYEEPSQSIQTMKDFDIDLLYVGPTERERYCVSLPVSGLDVVYAHGAVTIYSPIGSRFG